MSNHQEGDGRGDEIANASIRSSTGIAEINKALAQMDEVRSRTRRWSKRMRTQDVEGQANDGRPVAFFRLRVASAKERIEVPGAAVTPLKAVSAGAGGHAKSNLAVVAGERPQQAGLRRAQAEPDWKEF